MHLVKYFLESENNSTKQKWNIHNHLISVRRVMQFSSFKETSAADSQQSSRWLYYLASCLSVAEHQKPSKKAIYYNQPQQWDCHDNSDYINRNPQNRIISILFQHGCSLSLQNNIVYQFRINKNSYLFLHFNRQWKLFHSCGVNNPF